MIPPAQHPSRAMVGRSPTTPVTRSWLSSQTGGRRRTRLGLTAICFPSFPMWALPTKLRDERKNDYKIKRASQGDKKMKNQNSPAPKPQEIRLSRRSPAYWRVTFDHPPLNVFGPEGILEMAEIITAL